MSAIGAAGLVRPAKASGKPSTVAKLLAFGTARLLAQPIRQLILDTALLVDEESAPTFEIGVSIGQILELETMAQGVATREQAHSLPGQRDKTGILKLPHFGSGCIPRGTKVFALDASRVTLRLYYVELKRQGQS